MYRAGCNCALPVALISKDLHQANDDAIDVAVEALQAECCQVAASLVAWDRLVRAHQNQPLLHLRQQELNFYLGGGVVGANVVLQAERCQVTACLVAGDRLAWAHRNSPLMHLHQQELKVHLRFGC